MTPVEPGQTFDFEPFPPKLHGVDAAAQLSRYSSLSFPFRQAENDVRPADVFGGQAAAAQPGSELGFVRSIHLQLDCHR
jgi:hypothetical protein